MLVLSRVSLVNFNPRTPRGVRPKILRTLKTSVRNFNPRTPRGVRPLTSSFCCIERNFNPRTPRGVRRPEGGRAILTAHISIHAPREGCDRRGAPDGPYGQRFQSTHPARGATMGCSPILAKTGISIHAPREGCDQPQSSALFTLLYFNPRTPRGVRRTRGGSSQGRLSHFNPRTPRGVRLEAEQTFMSLPLISIHAPREGCD